MYINKHAVLAFLIGLVWAAVSFFHMLTLPLIGAGLQSLYSLIIFAVAVLATWGLLHTADVPHQKRKHTLQADTSQRISLDDLEAETQASLQNPLALEDDAEYMRRSH